MNNAVDSTTANTSYSMQIQYPEYESEISRIDSFKEWPMAMTPKRDDFNGTGLFYNGKGDKVFCFSCGLGLKDWETGDSPLIEHARLTVGCSYLDHVKGEQFVENVKKSFEEPDTIDWVKNEKNIVFFPYDHMSNVARAFSFTGLGAVVQSINTMNKIKQRAN